MQDMESFLPSSGEIISLLGQMRKLACMFNVCTFGTASDVHVLSLLHSYISHLQMVMVYDTTVKETIATILFDEERLVDVLHAFVLKSVCT